MNARLSSALVLICFAAVVVFFTNNKISDYDFWWHLKRGEVAYTGGGITATDSFSYTFPGKPQFNGEWLADLIMYLSYSFGGYTGVNMLKVSLVLAAFFILFAALKNLSADERTGLYSSVMILLLVLFALRVRLYNFRPFYFSYLFLSMFLFALSHYDRNRNIKILLLLPLVELAWANTSKGAFWGPLLFLFYIARVFFKDGKDYRLSAVFLAVIACSMISPETYRVYSLPFGVAAVDKSILVEEHYPLSAQMLWSKYGFKYTFGYQLLVLGSLVYFVFLKGWKNLYHTLAFVAFFVPSVMMVRMIDFFSIVSVLFMCRPLEAALGRVADFISARRNLFNFGYAGAILCLLVGLAAGNRTYAYGTGVKADVFPEGAMAFLDREGISGRMLNSYPFGGYIIWHSPHRKVFIDGRGYHYLYSTDFVSDYRKIIKKADFFESAVKVWDFDYVVAEYDTRGGPGSFPSHLNENNDWALVYWDNHSAVYLKRTKSNLSTIAAYAYKISKPRFYDFSYLQDFLESKTAPEAVRQIEREINLNPANQEPRLAKVFLLYGMGAGHYDAAVKELEITLQLKPDLAVEHSAMAFLMLEKGMRKDAESELRKAISLDKHDPLAKDLMAKLGIR